ncbi:hypothetical protein H2199_003582 [Coniosporium tulheliwenetii]|uniref:Uncharacterized protein n=1 Tax=Coniosporium tulheliwenetii TaxID=3383036 RepID=A0ACC2ZAA6_9PEZI|nr:hypothetical protein H2199_003582 [Cladosporium sp. JES 115]
MPPHLHPRSRLTTSLFTTTLFASFLVVGLPHLLPCPANPREYADGDMPELDPSGRRRRRRRKVVEGDTAMAGAHPLASEAPVVEEPKAADSALDEEGWERRRARECPVPKPGGLIGQVFGFQQDERQRPVVRIDIRTPDELHTLNLASTHSSRPLLTLWTASWCPSCGEVAPILRELVEEEGVGEQEGGVGYAEVELDAMTIGDMGVRFMINSIPTLLAFSRAEPQMETQVTRLEDLKNREFLRTWIRKEASRRGEGGAGGSLFGGWFGR